MRKQSMVICCCGIETVFKSEIQIVMDTWREREREMYQKINRELMHTPKKTKKQKRRCREREKNQRNGMEIKVEKNT